MSSVAVIYSKALYNIADEQRIKIAQDLKDFADALQISAPLEKALCSALLDAKSREDITEAVAKELKLQNISIRFLRLLAQKNRMIFLKEISQEYNNLCDRESGLVKGSLRTAIPLSADEVDGLAKAISKKIDRRVELIPEIDEALLGGFIAQVEGKTFDSSLKTQFQRLHEVCSIR